MGAGLAIDACASGARRYESGMKIPHIPARLFGVAALLVTAVNASAAPAEAPDGVILPAPARSAVELAEEGAGGFRVVSAKNKTYTTESIAVPVDILLATIRQAMVVSWASESEAA